MVQPLLLQRMLQRADDMFLTHEATEVLRPPFARKYLIAHGYVDSWRARPPALAGTSCGCFLPDLTRFTGLRCGEARRFPLCPSETLVVVSFKQACRQAPDGGALYFPETESSS